MELKFKKSAMLTWAWVLVLDDGREIPIKDMMTAICLPGLLLMAAMLAYEISKQDSLKEIEFNAYVTQPNALGMNRNCNLVLVSNEPQVICQNASGIQLPKVLNTSAP